MGRAKSAYWVFYDSVKSDKGNSYARCKRCSFIITNTQEKRLADHRKKFVAFFEFPYRFGNVFFLLFRCCSPEPTAEHQDEVKSVISKDSSAIRSQSTSSQPSVSRKRPFSLRDSIDIISQNDSCSLNILLTKFFIAHDIPFEAVSSIHLVKFMEKVRPAYKLPDPITMKTSILEEIHEEAIRKAKSETVTNAGFLFHKRTNNTIAVFLRPFFGTAFKFAEIDPSCLESLAEFKINLQKLSEMAREKFNYTIANITEDCIDIDLDDELQSKTLKTHSQAVATLLERSQNENLLNEVLSILDRFELYPPFYVETCKTELKAYEMYLENHLSLIGKTLGNCAESGTIRDKLYSSEFKNKIVKAFSDIQNAIKLTEKFEFVSDIIDVWLDVFQSTALIAENDELYESVFNTTGILCYLFDPKYKGEKLTGSQKMSCSFKILKKLADPDEFKIFCDYRDNKGIFASSDLDLLSSDLYWRAVEPACPKLAEIALFYSSFSSVCELTTYQDSACQSTEDDEKIAFIKSFL